MNLSYGLVLIILKQDLQLEYEINICTQPTFMKHGHQYNTISKEIQIGTNSSHLITCT
jgi:hypothetical protein